MSGIRAAVGVGGDVVAQVLLELLGGAEFEAGQRVVEALEVDPVGRVGDGAVDQPGHRGGVPVERLVRGEEVGPAGGGALGVGVEQLVVVPEGDLLGHQRPEVPA